MYDIKWVANHKALSISGYQKGLTFKKLKGNKKNTINKKTGKVTVKKKLKKETYKVTVLVTAKAENGTILDTEKVTFKVQVK